MAAQGLSAGSAVAGRRPRQEADAGRCLEHTKPRQGLDRAPAYDDGHPDHVGGLFEYLSARHTFEAATNVFTAQSVTPLVSDFAGDSIKITDFQTQPVTLIEPFAPDCDCRVSAMPFETCHLNVGPQAGATRGVVLSVDKSHNGRWIAQTAGVIVGDTEYNPTRGVPGSAVFDPIRRVLLGEGAGADRSDPRLLRFVVLHIGSSQLKNRRGGHLYLDGLISLVKDIDHYRDTHALGIDDDTLPILISEWGLEHAARAQIRAAWSQGAVPRRLEDAFSDVNLLRETVAVVEAAVNPRTLTLLPADVGLWIGLASGRVFTETRGPVPANRVKVIEGDDGLRYG
jgi:hypothetical protein